MTIVIPFSLKTRESLQNTIATHFQATPLFSMRTELLVLSQSSRSVDANAWCKWALTYKMVNDSRPHNFLAPNPRHDFKKGSFIFAARDSSYGKVMFSQASVCPQGVCVSRRMSHQGRCLPPSETATEVGGMHPTGMHSCYQSCCKQLCSLNENIL